MVHCLHRIDHWRQGGAWPDPGFVVETDSDVVPYRYRGYERHNLWRNRIALTENLETKPGMQEGNQ